MLKAVIVSGYFNPIHKGHLEYFYKAKAIADELFVVVNNDHQRVLKGNKEFQSEEEITLEVNQQFLCNLLQTIMSNFFEDVQILSGIT